MHLPFGPEDEKLPYPTIPMYVDCQVVEEYIIPRDEKREVLELLYLFVPVPGMDEEFYDVHEGRKFRVKDFRVIWEDGANFLVSPYYPSSGGTVIDWMPAELADEE